MNNDFNITWENGATLPKEYFDPLTLMYPIIVCAGIIAVLALSIIKLIKKRIPLKEFITSIYIALPFGVIGASFFGKLGSMENGWKYFYKLFFFWQPGLSFFGAMLFGGVATTIWFLYKSKNTKISVWVYADCIVPNILIGQAIGRWGNLFNHEILGRNVDVNKINWLPEFIWHRLFYIYNPQTGERFTEIHFCEPLFLYESISTLCLWIIIIFFVPKIFRLFGKKPWDVQPIDFPCKKNKIYKSIDDNDLKEYPTQISIKYLRDKNDKLYLSQKNVWLKAYYYYEPDIIDVRKEQSKINLINNNVIKAKTNYEKTKQKIKNEIEKIKINYKKNKITKEIFVKKRDEIIKLYSTDLKKYKKERNKFKAFLIKDSKQLYKLNNPNNYNILHCGTLSSIYIILYTMLRIILDSFRNPYELTIKQNVILNYLFLILFLAIGITLFVFAQFIAPRKWREEGWLYEKSY